MAFTLPLEPSLLRTVINSIITDELIDLLLVLYTYIRVGLIITDLDFALENTRSNSEYTYVCYWKYLRYSKKGVL